MIIPLVQTEIIRRVSRNKWPCQYLSRFSIGNMCPLCYHRKSSISNRLFNTIEKLIWLMVIGGPIVGLSKFRYEKLRCSPNSTSFLVSGLAFYDFHATFDQISMVSFPPPPQSWKSDDSPPKKLALRASPGSNTLLVSPILVSMVDSVSPKVNLMGWFVFARKNYRGLHVNGNDLQ